MTPNLRRVRTTRDSSFLKDMSQHRSNWVRFVVASNDHLPLPLMKRLVTDTNGLVRYKVALRLADMYEHKKINLSGREMAKVAGVLESNSFAVLKRIRSLRNQRAK
jgi:hypothetical protein